MKAEKPSRLSYALNFIKAAYYGRNDFYKKMGKFLATADAPEGLSKFLKIDEKWIDRERQMCYCIDLVIVGAASITANPFVLAGLAPSIFLRYHVAMRTNNNIDYWESYKSNMLDGFYLFAGIKNADERLKKPKKRPEPNIYQQELGLGSIDDIIKDYEEYKDPKHEDPEQV